MIYVQCVLDAYCDVSKIHGALSIMAIIINNISEQVKIVYFDTLALSSNFISMFDIEKVSLQLV